MKVIHWGRARKFIAANRKAKAPLDVWKTATQASTWQNYPEIKETFNTVDWYKGHVIFDIGGNKFRLIAICRFELGHLYIQDIMTHKEYDKGLWKKRIDERWKE